MASRKQSAQFYTPPTTPDVEKAREFTPEPDPVLDQTREYAKTLLNPQDMSSIPAFGALTNAYDVAGRSLEESYASPYSGVTNPVLRQRLHDLSLQQLTESKGQALTEGLARERSSMVGLSIEGKQSADQMEENRRLAIARLTAPQLYGNSGNGTANTAISAGATIATAAIIS